MQSPIAAEQSEKFEATVTACLQKLIAGQEEIKSDLESFKRDVTRSVEFMSQEIEELKESSSNYGYTTR